jgi:hypothetical protein
MTTDNTAPGAAITFCSAMFEDVPPNRRRTTHTCSRRDDHESPWHLCPTCCSYWQPDGTTLKPGDPAWWQEAHRGQ